MKRDLPPLNAMRAFEAAARHRSFTGAAGELNVTPAAVSHQVKGLEDYVGVRLFRRQTRGLALTEAGAGALPDVTTGLDAFARALAGLREEEAQRPLTVSAAPSFAGKWLVPRLEDFRRHANGTEIRLDTSERLSDFAADDVDVAIRYGPGQYSGMHVERLAKQAVFPVCSPWLLERGPALNQPSDLAGHTLIHVDWARAGLSAPDWKSWLETAGAPGVDPGGGPHFGQQSMAIQAAVAGHGVALGSAILVADDLAAQRLVRPFRHALTEPNAYYLVCPQATAQTRRFQQFRDWLFTEMEATPGAE
jgi:LysR family glycine cleavage system transcriptional activator